LGTLYSTVPTDAEFESAFATARVSQAYLARYYLRSLELHQMGQPDPEWIPNESTVINLEHVLPANPESNWPNIDSETAAANYKRIGNLALLQASKNQIVGNRSFAEKKPILASSSYVLTQEIAKQADWGIDEINSRQKSLARLAVATWPLQV